MNKDFGMKLSMKINKDEGLYWNQMSYEGIIRFRKRKYMNIEVLSELYMIRKRWKECSDDLLNIRDTSKAKLLTEAIDGVDV